MADIEIKRGYEVLPDNNIRFGVRVINTSDAAILDVEVILDYNESQFDLEGIKVQSLGTIPPVVPRTAKFILKPRGCIHKEEISATVRYKDHQWKRYSQEMRPKEVHCVYPFLKEKPITRADFLALSSSGYKEERGANFEAITVDKLLSFLLHTCENRLYYVDEVPIENGRILYLAGDAVGEKAYYLLTAVVKEYEGIIQVLLRASSDKRHGLTGFLNEILENLRHLVTSARAREIGLIKKEQVINIIDSVVQRTTFATGEGAVSVHIEESVVQRAEFTSEEAAKRRREEEEERLRQEREAAEKREREEREHLRREEERKEQQRKAREEGASVRLIRWAEKRAREQEQKEEHARKLLEEQRSKTLTNSISMEFTLIPAGEFYMGLDEYKDEQPMHEVKIPPFYLGTYPVTQREWKAIMGENPSHFKTSLFKGDNRPVESVSWDDVQEFIKKLNKKTMREGTDKYRLPSEAEWEYACRAGTTTSYSFGDSKSELGEYAWYKSNSGRTTQPVGLKKPNPWGLYDMHGNVWEWVQDIYHSNYVGAPTDGYVWEGEGAKRVCRGGSWFSTAAYCRSSTRHCYPSRRKRKIIGFRLVRSL